MCGITGIIGSPSEQPLRLMTQLLYHRGPDDGAIWMSPSGVAGLGHRRLSIIDPSPEAAQPMLSPDGRYALVFNGEIFNYCDLRDQLSKKGHRFRTDSDSEVLLHACMEWGETVLHKLVGQFAFALWDERERTLFAARDHLGIKPFYYAHDDTRFLFASEAKSLLAVAPEYQRVDWELFPTYLALLWVPGERTLFKGIRKLLPGSWLRFTAGRLETGRYWDPIDRWKHAQRHRGNAAQRQADFRSLFDSAVRSQLVSDVPLGLLLSGGLDSTIILSAMADTGDVPEAYTATYSGKSRARDIFDDDVDYARMAASHFGAKHDIQTLETDVVSLLNKSVWHLDEPMADPTVVTNLALTREAKSSLTVLLSGMGADEILAGYPRYPAALLERQLRFVPKWKWKLSSAVLQSLLNHGLASMERNRRAVTLLQGLQHRFPQNYLAYSSYFTAQEQSQLLSTSVLEQSAGRDVFDFHNTLLGKTEGLSPLQRMLAVDLGTFLPYLNLENMDKTAMANGVEIRVPFLDHRLVEFCMTLPDSDKLRKTKRKAILRAAYSDVVPGEILNRPKTGYSPPVRGWVRDSLSEFISDTLLSRRSLERGLYNKTGLEAMLRHNAEGRRDHSINIWSMLVFELWQQRFIDDFRAEPVEDPGVLRRIESVTGGET